MTAQEKRSQWLNKNAFDAAGVTYVYAMSDSYDIKDQLKEAGFRFNSSMLWHIAVLPELYATKCVAVKVSEVADFTAWGEGTYKPEAKSIVRKHMEILNPPAESTSEYIEPDEDNNIITEATCVSKRMVEGRFGMSNVITFEDLAGNVMVWWTSSEPDIEVGQIGTLKAKFKQHNEFKGIKQTQVTRVKFA